MKRGSLDTKQGENEGRTRRRAGTDHSQNPCFVPSESHLKNKLTRATMKENIISAAVALAMSAALVSAIIYGTSKSDQNDCMKLQAEAGTYSAPFFISKDQKAQCDYWGITVNAPVK